MTAFGECCGKVDRYCAFSYAALAAYYGDFVFNFAHPDAKLLNLLLLLEKSLFSNVHNVRLIGCFGH